MIIFITFFVSTFTEQDHSVNIIFNGNAIGVNTDIGTSDVLVRGTLTVLGTESPGAYTGTYQVSVAY